MKNKARLWLVCLILCCWGSLTAGAKPEQTNIFEKELPAGVKESDASPEFTPRIIGGADTPPGRYPFYTYLEITKIFANGDRGAVRCGGALIHSNIVLTAAHCFADPNTVEALSALILANVTSLNQPSDGFTYQRESTTWELHPDYNVNTLENDLAVIFLDRPITQVTPIVFNEANAVPPDGADVEVMGFGALNAGGSSFPTTLQSVTLQTVNSETCVAQLSRRATVDPEIHLCAAAENKDSCVGDSGGPLVYRPTADGDYVHVGIVSFGIGCAEPSFPGVYARVSSYTAIIKLAICTQGVEPKPAYCGTAPTVTAAPTTSSPVTPSPTSPITTPPPPSGNQVTIAPIPVTNATSGPTTPAPSTPAPTPPAMTPAPTPNTTSTPPSQVPSSTPSVAPPTPVRDEPNSRSIEISRTGVAIATSNIRGPLRMQMGDGADFTLALPGGLDSLEDVSLTKEGFVIGLSIYTPALCSFEFDSASTLLPIGCITGNWSMAPFTGMSAEGGTVVISGGTGGVTIATYNTTSGVLNDILECLNCEFGDPGDNIMMPGVSIATRPDGPPLASLAIVFPVAQEFQAGFLILPVSDDDDDDLTDVSRVLFNNFIGTRLAVTVTNYPLASAFYYVPQLGFHFVYMVHGEMVVYNTRTADVQPVALPLAGLRASVVAVDELNGVLVVGGLLLDRESYICVYDILDTPLQPQLRIYSPVEGRLLSLAANGGKIAYVTAEFPAIAIFDTAGTPLPTISPSRSPSGSPSMVPTNSSAPSQRPSNRPTGSPRTTEAPSGAVSLSGSIGVVLSTLLFMVAWV